MDDWIRWKSVVKTSWQSEIKSLNTPLFIDRNINTLIKQFFSCASHLYLKLWSVIVDLHDFLQQLLSSHVNKIFNFVNSLVNLFSTRGNGRHTKQNKLNFEQIFSKVHFFQMNSIKYLVLVSCYIIPIFHLNHNVGIEFMLRSLLQRVFLLKMNFVYYFS